MATLQEYEKQTIKERVNRTFSEDLKRKWVSELDRNLLTIPELCREHEVSRTSVYRWIYRYSGMRKKGLKQVVEAKSESGRLLQMGEQIKELQRIIGEKQVKLDFQEKMIALAEAESGIDIKKKVSGPRCSGTGSTAKRTKLK
jgi:transposase-like protein